MELDFPAHWLDNHDMVLGGTMPNGTMPNGTMPNGTASNTHLTDQVYPIGLSWLDLTSSRTFPNDVSVKPLDPTIQYVGLYGDLRIVGAPQKVQGLLEHLSDNPPTNMPSGLPSLPSSLPASLSASLPTNQQNTPTIGYVDMLTGQRIHAQYSAVNWSDPFNPVEVQMYVGTYDGVKLVGTYDDVMGLLGHLQSSPPVALVASNRRVDLFTGLPVKQPIDRVTRVTLAHAPVGSTEIIGANMRVTIGNTKYSGAGCLVITQDQANPAISYFCLFRNKKTQQYGDLGGHVSADQVPSTNTLWETAQREAIEESFDMFQMATRSDTFVDISAIPSDTKYRAYVYLIRANTSGLSEIYRANRTVFLNKYDEILANIHGYNETDAMQLFESNTMRRQIQSNPASKWFRDSGGRASEVSPRVINLIRDMEKNKTFDDLFGRSNVLVPTIQSNQITI